MPQVVGRKGRSRKIVDTPPVNLWQTDVIDNQDPEYAYQFYREEQVRDKLKATRLNLVDYETGKATVHDIPGWEIVRRDIGPEENAGYRPDEGKPVDNVLRHGPHVAMKIKRKYWDLLQLAQEQRADAYETKLQGGSQQEYNLEGSATKYRPGKITPGNIRITQHPLARV